MIEIEIKGHYGQFIQAYLRTVVEDKGVIVYADDESSEETIPLSELRLPQKFNPDSLVLVNNQRVEALLPLNVKEDSRENSFTEALANLKIQSTATSSRLANPFACLTCTSWWPCVVQKARDDHAVIQLCPVIPEVTTGAPTEYTELAASLATITEICERKMLRPASVDVPCLRPEDFYRNVIDIPPDLIQYASDPAVHECMLKHCNGPASIMFENGQVVILSPSDEVIRVATLLEEMHVRMLRQKHSITRYISLTKRSHENMTGSKDGQHNFATDTNTWSSDEGHYSETFQVPVSLMGLAIGTQGSNIRAARALPGIIRIDVKEAATGTQRNGGVPWGHGISNSVANADSDVLVAAAAESEPMATFKIVAESEEQAKAARSLLEFCQLCLLVPHRLIGRVLGTRTSNILSINEKSGVKHIHLEEQTNHLPTQVDECISQDSNTHPTCLRIKDIHPELASQHEQDAEGGFFIIGTREAVEKARLLISFQIDCIFDLEKLEAEKIDLLRELPPREPRALQDMDSSHRENGSGPRRGRGGGMMGGRNSEWRNRDGGADNYQQMTNYYQPGSGDPYDENAQPSNSRGGFGGRGKRGMRGARYNGPPRSSGDMSDHAGFESTDHEEHVKQSDGEQQQFGERRGNGRGRRARRGGQVANGGGRKPEMNGTGVEDSNGGHADAINFSTKSGTEQVNMEVTDDAISYAPAKELHSDAPANDGAKKKRQKKAQVHQQ